MSDLNDLNRPVTTDTEPNVLDTLRAHIIRAATWSGWSGTANKVAGLMSGVTAAVSGGRSMRLYRRNDFNTADEEVVSLPGVSIGGSAVSASASGISDAVACLDVDRTLATVLPNSGPYRVRYDFVNAGVVGSGGNYAGVMTLTPLTGDTVSTGDGSYQLAFGSTAANGGGVPQMRLRKGIDTTWNAWIDLVTSANIAGLVATLGAATATKLTTGRANWVGSGVEDSVVGQLAWRNYGNDHTIFDASKGLSPGGGAIDPANAQNPWATTHPTLMGWDGLSTFGVRVDSARVADKIKGDVGMVAHFARSTAPAGWLKANGGTIGSSASGATLRAHADTLELFTVLWADFGNAVLPIQTSAGAPTTRGASASADFAANKRLPVFDLRAEFVRGWDDGRGVDAARVLGSPQAGSVESHTHAPPTGLTAPWLSNSLGGGDGEIDGSGTVTGNDRNPATGNTQPYGGAETRPRSIALLACIRY